MPQNPAPQISADAQRTALTMRRDGKTLAEISFATKVKIATLTKFFTKARSAGMEVPILSLEQRAALTRRGLETARGHPRKPARKYKNVLTTDDEY